MQTSQRWAFGVDENTAYIWRPDGEMEVVGATGVAIFENTTGTSESQQTVMHFLTSGDTINAKESIACARPVVCPAVETWWSCGTQGSAGDTPGTAYR